MSDTGGDLSKLRFRISMSLDGYIAGPEQSKKDPLGLGGEGLHEWVFPLAAWRAPLALKGGTTFEGPAARPHRGRAGRDAPQVLLLVRVHRSDR